MVELFVTFIGVGGFATILGVVLWVMPGTKTYGKDITIVGCAISAFSVLMFVVFKPAGTPSGAAQASTSTDTAPAKGEQAEPPKIPAPLKISSWKCTHAYGFMTIEGEVLNRSDKAIDNLVAVGGFTTQDDEFVKSATGMVEYQPLLPGQRSYLFPSWVTSLPTI